MEIILNNKRPKYIQVFEQISKMINSGILKSDTRLPSKRTLALSLNVSLNTIVNAYDLLLDEGYIYTIEKKGYFVSNQPIVSIPSAIDIAIDSKENKIAYDFTTQAVEGFLNPNWKKLAKEIIDSSDYTNNEPFNGSPKLRAIIAKHLYENRGISVSYNQIIIGSGIEMFEHILKVIDCNSITMENPGYHKLKIIAQNIGIKEEYIGLDNEGALVPNKKTILYTTPFNQFPTGVKMSISRKKELIKWATETKSYIIEDDFDAEFRINSAPTTSLFTLSNDRVIFFSTFSTTLFPGLRLSYAILPINVLNKYEEKYNKYSNTVSSLSQKILAEFINRGYYASHINKLKRLYLRKREKCIEVLSKYNIEYDGKKNYLSLLIKLPDFKMKEDIKIQSLASYDINNKKTDVYILGYTSIPIDEIDEAIKVLIK
ncbi:MAG: PLP-dependent aminotransferase family protein [Erysipelotrichaceae bacterium]|nr:PLP-dependent aminotransferase family protein [Erysipelotrichaceae bacterium]